MSIRNSRWRWALPVMLQAAAITATPVVAEDEEQVITITNVSSDEAVETKKNAEATKSKAEARASIFVRGAELAVERVGEAAVQAAEVKKDPGRVTVRGQIRVTSPDGKTIEINTPDGGTKFLHEMKADQSHPGSHSFTIIRKADGEVQKFESGDVQTLIGELTSRVKEGAETPKFVIGVSVSAAPEAVMAQVGKPETPAVVVDAVVSESPAAKAGVKKFDLILKAAGEPVKSPADLTKAVKATDGKELELVLVRTGQELTLQLTPRSNAPPAGTIKEGQAMVHFGPGMMMTPQSAFYGQLGQTQGNVLEEVKAMRKDLEELKKLIEELKASK